ncbi:hypothetical protein DPMN_045416 [Dreissena polymorpha]|uniref:Uncharacterized protein n=1 Tax=Dreissena polymorpha TaxID=45954 RepID=A0A9D4HZP9_DREPO|nr:hypothetical protein DPMN_045416 [Dreissena polymorpha]
MLGLGEDSGSQFSLSEDSCSPLSVGEDGRLCFDCYSPINAGEAHPEDELLEIGMLDLGEDICSQFSLCEDSCSQLSVGKD